MENNPRRKNERLERGVRRENLICEESIAMSNDFRVTQKFAQSRAASNLHSLIFPGSHIQVRPHWLALTFLAKRLLIQVASPPWHLQRVQILDGTIGSFNLNLLDEKIVLS